MLAGEGDPPVPEDTKHDSDVRIDPSTPDWGENEGEFVDVSVNLSICPHFSVRRNI